MQEIERKYILKSLPTETPQRVLEVEQAYLIIGNEELRIRRIPGHQPSLSIKKGSGLVREETEMDITDTLYDALMPFAVGKLRKTRYIYPHEWSVDQFHTNNPDYAGLLLAEVELPAHDAPIPPPPEGFDPEREVTFHTRYRNSFIARAF